MSHDKHPWQLVRPCLGLAAVLLMGFILLVPARGAEYANLSLTIRCTNLNPFAGDEIPIEFIITNRGTSVYTYMDRNYDRSGRMSEYQLKAVDVDRVPAPDPRAQYKGGIMGGLSGERKLAPGTSFTKTIALNRWALIKAGCYEVTGTYFVNQSTNSIKSQPIGIIVRPRSESEMEDYINGLHEQLKHGGSREALVQKLMFTCHPKIIPILLETLYWPSSGFWETEAFLYYLPRNEEIKQALMETAKKRGLASNMQYVLSQYGCTNEQMYPLIKRSLAPDTPETWAGGALAAQQYANDDFTPRLIAIATDPNSKARSQAIYALALNRTDESVKALKTLLNDPDRSIRETTTNAIRTAYKYRGNSQGWPLREEDFEDKFR